jgi:hypothetical protein
MKRFHVLYCLSLMAFGFSAAPASADHYLNIPNANILLEHLVRHSDELLTEVNLTRANQFTVINPVIADIRYRGGWGAGFYSRMLVDPRNTTRIPEYFIGQIVNDFRMNTILLYDFWWKNRGPSPMLARQWVVTDYSYTNAMAATYFYIEALRRSYLIRGAQGRCWSQPVLLRRLVKLERLAWELRELMMSIRYANSLRFPNRRVCLESTYRPYRVNVQVNVAQNFVPFPFVQGEQTFAPQDIRPVAPGSRDVSGPNYDSRYWNQRYTEIDNSYINGPQSAPPNAPGNYDERPYTPGNPGQSTPPPTNYGPGPSTPGYPEVRDPLAQPVQPGGGQPGGQPSYPVPSGSGGDVVPSNDYRYN